MHENHRVSPEEIILEKYSEKFDYSEAPMLVYWESTRACDLACTHCRAEAVPSRDPDELTTDEVKKFFDQLNEFNPADNSRPKTKIVITGGDPLKRPDLFELIDYGMKIGLDISITPAGTSLLTKDILIRLKEAGITGLGLSIDGSNAQRHDGIRKVPGSFDMTVNACRQAVELGFPVQVNSMLTSETLDDIPDIYELLKEIAIARWALFFLIPTGRGQSLKEISAEESEKFLNYLCKVQATSPFPIKTTEAHHFRRIAYFKLKHRGMSDEAIVATPLGKGFGIRDANGIMFVSHTGDVYPSGFLPLRVDNIRKTAVTEIYRNSDIFKNLRDLKQLKGRCGECEFRCICGGSRARAFAVTGDPLESDPLCIY